MGPYLDLYLAAAFTSVVALTLGALGFGAAAVAPLAVRLLPAEAAGRLLRAFWIRFHRFGIACGAGITVACAASAFLTPLPTSYSAVLATLAGVMTGCLAVGDRLIPAINHARDVGDTARFNRLHRLDIVLVAVALLARLVLLVAAVYALPAFFGHA